jgi:hypothetical protein
MSTKAAQAEEHAPRPDPEVAHDVPQTSDALNVPRALRIIAYAVTILVTAYPIYLGVETLKDKREESRREAAVHEQQLREEAVRQKEQWQRDDALKRDTDYKKAREDAEAAVARKEEARLRLEIAREESSSKIELSKVEIRERERKEASAQAERVTREFQDQLARVLDASPQHLAGEIAGLNRFFKGTPDQRNAIIMIIEARLEGATTPAEVYPVFSALQYLGQDAFSIVLRHNQDTVAGLHNALEADYREHRLGVKAGRVEPDTVSDIYHAFPGSAAAGDLKGWLDYIVGHESLNDAGASDPDTPVAKVAHQNLLVQFAMLKASRDAISSILASMHSQSIAMDRCFLPDVTFTVPEDVEQLEFRDSYMRRADLRKLPLHTAVHIRHLKSDLLDTKPENIPVSSIDSLDRAQIEYLPGQTITVK